jgi:toxin ParE1/3/4
VRLTSFDIVGPARRDLARIFRDSETRFGLVARNRYQALVDQAIRDLMVDSNRLGTQADSGRIHYHLRHYKNRVAGETVRDPRHLLVVRTDGSLMIVLAIVHDAMVEGMARRIGEGEGGSESDAK